MPPKTQIIGRTEEQAQLLVKLLSPDTTRLLTITGFPGTGKSALACSTLHFVQERGLFAGGCVYVDCRGVSRSEVVV